MERESLIGERRLGVSTAAAPSLAQGDQKLSPAAGGSGRGQRFSLQLVGSVWVHRLTTLPMLPWVVAEVRRRSARGSGTRRVRLQVWQGWVRCVAAAGSGPDQDSSGTVFEHRAQHIHKLLHNSNELSYFAYLTRSPAEGQQKESLCFVFRASDPTLICDSACLDLSVFPFLKHVGKFKENIIPALKELRGKPGSLSRMPNLTIK